MLINQAKAGELCALLGRLYREQGTRGMAGAYLAEHGRLEVIKHQVNVFCWYARHLSGGSVLDWGCQHGPDACMLRAAFGEAIDLHACDFVAESDHQAFRAAARARYAQLTNPFELPYPNDTFDAVIGSGALEHTAMDGESLKALYRVMRPGAVLALSYLPYARSWAEWKQRNVKKKDYHRRLYDRRSLSQLLKSHGLYPLEVQFHTFLPNVVDDRRSSWLKRTVRRLRYLPFSHSTICAIAQKVVSM